MKVQDINADDPVWTPEQSAVLSILQRKRDQYNLRGQVSAAHGVLVLTASVFLEHRLDIDVTDFGDL